MFGRWRSAGAAGSRRLSTRSDGKQARAVWDAACACSDAIEPDRVIPCGDVPGDCARAHCRIRGHDRGAQSTRVGRLLVRLCLGGDRARGGCPTPVGPPTGSGEIERTSSGTRAPIRWSEGISAYGIRIRSSIWISFGSPSWPPIRGPVLAASSTARARSPGTSRGPPTTTAASPTASSREG